jgi:hypothetical protein
MASPVVDRLPAFPRKMKEGKPRKGFNKDKQFALLAANAKTPWLRYFIECAYKFGFRNGSRVVAPRKEWYSLCVSSSLGRYELVERKNGESYKKYVGLYPHDFRRSALRNMTRRGVTEKVAMTISGAIHTVSFRPLQHRGRDGPGGSNQED